MVAVTEDGFELLTPWPEELGIILLFHKCSKGLILIVFIVGMIGKLFNQIVDEYTNRWQQAPT